MFSNFYFKVWRLLRPTNLRYCQTVGTLGTRGNSLAKSGWHFACFAHFGPHARFASLWPAGFSKRVASGTQGRLLVICECGYSKKFTIYETVVKL